MKRIELIVLVLCFATGLRARADEWTKTFTLTGKPDLRVETSDANIRVYTWDQNTIEAKVITTHYKIGEGGIRVEDHQNGDTVEIDVRYPHHNVTFGIVNHRVDIDIHMPREGRVNLHTGDGKIEVTSFKGEMDLRSGDGPQLLVPGDGPCDVRAAAGSSVNAAWRLETGDGSVTLEIPETLAADVDLHTSDGHIDLDIPVATDGKLRENEVRGKINGGGSLMTIRA